MGKNSESFIHAALERAEVFRMIVDMESQGWEVVKVPSGYVCHELGTHGLILVMQAKLQKSGAYFVKFNTAFLPGHVIQSAMVH